MPKPLSIRLYQDPCLFELAKLIGYQGIPYPIGREETERLNAKYGKEKIIKAADELLEYDKDTKFAKLKSNVRVFCRQLLGPLPEEWDEFYANVENPPPNPYKAKPVAIDKPKEVPPTALPIPERPSEELPDQSFDEGEPDSGPRRMVPPPEMTAEEMIRRLDNGTLQKLLHDARWGVDHYGPKSRQGRQFKRDVAMSEAECARRGLRNEQTAQPSEVELLRSMHGRKLRSLLLSQHVLIRNYRPGDPTHQEAAARMELVETEMRKRGQKIPERPTPAENDVTPREQRVRDLEGTELMRRYFKAKQILEEESEHTGVWQQTKIEYDLLRGECERRDIALPPTGFDDPARLFRQATTHRLNELLDMNQYEVAKYGPETVTHQEAARDAALIEAELRRRHAF